MTRLVVVLSLLFSGGSAHAQKSLAPEKGVFLVAKSEIDGGPFHQSVVLLLAHGDKGSLGLIVNRPTEIPLSEALPEFAGRSTHELYFGGPVGLDGLLFLFRSDEPPPSAVEAEHVLGSVYYSGDRKYLEELMRAGTKSDELRLFVGHSGWAPSQLDAELARRSWDVIGADASTVFTKDPELMWLELSKDNRVIAQSRSRSGSSRPSRPSLRSARGEGP